MKHTFYSSMFATLKFMASEIVLKASINLNRRLTLNVKIHKTVHLWNVYLLACICCV